MSTEKWDPFGDFVNRSLDFLDEEQPLVLPDGVQVIRHEQYTSNDNLLVQPFGIIVDGKPLDFYFIEDGICKLQWSVDSSNLSLRYLDKFAFSDVSKWLPRSFSEEKIKSHSIVMLEAGMDKYKFHVRTSKFSQELYEKKLNEGIPFYSVDRFVVRTDMGNNFQMAASFLKRADGDIMMLSLFANDMQSLPPELLDIALRHHLSSFDLGDSVKAVLAIQSIIDAERFK